MPEVIADTSPVKYLYQANVLYFLPHVAALLDRLESLQFHLDLATRRVVLTLVGEAS